MVRKLILVRHAEAGQSADSDFERTLTGNGERVARHLAEVLSEQFPEIDRIISSAAVRAISTAEILSETIGVSVKIEAELYESSVRTFLSIVNQVDNNLVNCLLVGHNPTISYLSEYITGEAVNLEPAGTCVIDIPVEWSEVGEDSGQLFKHLSPREFAP